MKFKIKLAGLKDLSSFFRAFSASLKKQFPEYSKNTITYFLEEEFNKNSIRKKIKTKEKQLFLAIVDKKVIGYLLASVPYGGIGFCNWIAVNSEYQKQGIASALLEKWEKQALKDGAHKLQLWSDKRNINLYKNRDYNLVGYIPDNWFGANDYLFYKPLRKAKESNFLRDFLKKKRDTLSTR